MNQGHITPWQTGTEQKSRSKKTKRPQHAARKTGLPGSNGKLMGDQNEQTFQKLLKH